jgi:hypothetical protein
MDGNSKIGGIDGILKIGGIVLLVIVGLVVLYKLYMKWVEDQNAEPIFFDNRSIYGNFRDTTKPYTISANKILKSGYGLEYSYSVWIKVDDFNYRFGKAKHILHKGPQDITVCNPGIFLAPNTNQLMIRVDTKETNSVYRSANNRRINEGTPIKTLYDVKEDDCKRECSTNSDCNSFSLDQLANQCTFFSNKLPAIGENGGEFNKYPEVKNVVSYSKQKSMNPKYYDSFELNHNLPCDIIDLPLQRWNHGVVILWNRSLDVYLNGKLARSCTLQSVPILNDGPVYVTQEGGYKGDMASLKYYNRALNAEEVYSVYKKGPDSASLSKLIPKVNLSISASADITSEND